MNDLIKEMSISLLEEAQEITNSIDLEDNKENICEQLNEITNLIEKVKTGVSKIK